MLPFESWDLIRFYNSTLSLQEITLYKQIYIFKINEIIVKDTACCQLISHFTQFLLYE